MRIGISLPVRELGEDLDLIVAFAQEAENLGLTHLRVPEQVYRAGQWAVARIHDDDDLYRGCDVED